MLEGPLTGQTLAGRFKIKHLLGEGGLGEVYLAEHETLGIFYAVKVLQEQVADDEKIVRRFKREAFAASRLDHLNAVQIYDFGRTDDGLFYLVMEYVDGPTLEELVAEAMPRPMPRRRALQILAQVCKALDAAHEAHIVHRDLNPANIRIAKHRGDEDLAKIFDFGLAKVLAGDSENPLSATGEIFGTPKYMSPEQARGEQVDHRTDLYALGVLAFEVLTACPPFDYPLLPRLLQAHMDEPPPRPNSLLPIDVPPLPHPLEAMILQLLAKDRKDRPASATELLDVIEQVLAEAPPRRAVPKDVAKALDTQRPGSSWGACEPAWKPGDYAPTMPTAGRAIDSPAMHPGDPAYRIWYWSQAIKLAATIGHRLVRDELATPELKPLLERLEQLEDELVSSETDLALAESSLDELDTALQQRAAELKNGIVDTSMSLDSLAGQEPRDADAHAELFQRIKDLEAELASHRERAAEQKTTLESDLATKRAALAELRKQQMDQEVALLNHLDEARPEPCPAFYAKSYATVAEMLQALRISDGVDLPG